jgi:hypothetical protein
MREETQAMETTEVVEAIKSGNADRSFEEAESVLRAAVRAYGLESIGDTGRLLGIVGDEIGQIHEEGCEFIERYAVEEGAKANYVSNN